MKKAYSKPVIIFESFSTSQNIAAGCEVKTNTPAQGKCGIEWGTEILFLDSVGSLCTGDSRVTDVGGDGESNGICYHVFSNNGENNLFNS